MNNTFNLQRFSLLLKRQWLEFGKIYLISLGVLLGVFLTFYGNFYYNVVTYGVNPSASAFRIPLFIISGIIFITIAASSYFAHFGQKPRAIIDLLIPASTLEKFMAGVFFTTVLGILSYLLLFYLTDLAFITKLKIWHETSGNNMYLDGKKVQLNLMFPYFFAQDRQNLPLPIFLAPFFITSIFLLGSIYFEKFHYIKTAIIVLIFSGIWSVIISKASKVLFEGKIPINKLVNNGLIKDMFEPLMSILLVVLTLIFWAITYVRLKEKEV